MKHSVIIQNLKCGGCATTITNEINKLEAVSNTAVNEEESTVSFDSKLEDISPVLHRLDQLGYPPEDVVNTFGKKAKSYVSCVIGRMS